MNYKEVTGNWHNKEYWTNLCPNLNIISDQCQSQSNEKKTSVINTSQSTSQCDVKTLTNAKNGLLKDGYALVDEAASMNWSMQMKMVGCGGGQGNICYICAELFIVLEKKIG